MNRRMENPGNGVLIKGAALWLFAALVLAWCLVFLKLDLPVMKMIFQGDASRLLKAHLDLLLMSALLFGFYAADIPLPRHVRWAMVIGAFTNSSLFLMQAMFPVLDSPEPVEGLLVSGFRGYLMASIVLTSYGFGRGAICVFLGSIRGSGPYERLAGK